MSIDVATALAELRRHLEELDEIAGEADANYGLAHLDRWKDHTKLLIAQHISQQEAEKFYPSDGRRLAGNTDPRRQLQYHAGHYRSHLVALVRDLERNGGRYLARDPGPTALPPTLPTAEGDPRKVFVVHGRNAKARDAMFSFLRTLKLDPMEWNDAMRLTGEATPYVGRVLEAGFAECQAAVILLTGDDEVRLRQEFRKDHDEDYEQHLTPQPRPNVLFEAGYAFGRFEKRTILVEVGAMRPISDIIGRHTVRLRDTPETRQDLKSRLQTAGCIVDVPGIDWLRAGDFTAAIEATSKRGNGFGQ